MSAIVRTWPLTAEPDGSQANSAARDVEGGPAHSQRRTHRVEQMVRRHLGSVWRTARDLGVPERDLEDVAQEVMIVVVRRLADIEPGKERAFMLASTTRVVANWRRGRRRRPAELSDTLDETETGSPISSNLISSGIAPGHASPLRAAECRQELELVERALGSMTDAQRACFSLFELEQLSAREIAEQLGLTEAVVFARVRRAREVFKRHCARARENSGHEGDPTQ